MINIFIFIKTKITMHLDGAYCIELLFVKI